MNELDLYLIYFLIIIQFLSFLVNIKNILRYKIVSKYNYLRSLVVYRKVKKHNPFIVLPYTSFTPWSLWYFTSSKIVFTLCHSEKYWKNRNYSEHYNEYPNLAKEKFKFILNELKVDCLFVSKSLAHRIDDLTKGFKVLYSDQIIIIYIKEKC